MSNSIIEDLNDMTAIASGAIAASLPRRELTLRKPGEILGMEFDSNDRLLGDRLMAKGQPFTVLAAGGTGKSRLLLQLAACMITGREFIGLVTRGRGLRWLILQTENSNQRLQHDLAALRAWVGDEQWALVEENLFIHTMETDEDGMMNLSDATNQKAIQDAIEKVRPDIIAFDPLGDFAIGDPNQDECMRATCQAISRLGKKGNPNRALVVLHHALTGKVGAARATGHDRASFGRNSKVLQAWTRGQMNIAAVTPDSNERLVIACGKCSNGKEFAPFGVRLNPDSMIYEVDPSFSLEAWQAEIAGKSMGPVMTPDRVQELCLASGMTKADLAKTIMDDCGCVRQSAYRHIARAEQAGKVSQSKANGHYLPK